MRIEKDLRNLDKDDIYRKDKIVSWAMSVLWQMENVKKMSNCETKNLRTNSIKGERM
ncbi:hypothetical protein YC2023_058699 [Brassica napus]